MEQNKLKSIKNNILALKNNVSDIAAKCGRNYDDITIIGVTKRFPAEYAKIAYEYGLKNLGENRVEELIEKREVLIAEGITPMWHMIGTLQRKKVKKIIGNASLIHSVESYKLANEISVESIKTNINTSALLQVNLSGELSKQGFTKREISERFEELTKIDKLSIKGLMTMAPFTDDEYILSKTFSDTFDLFCELKEKYSDIKKFNILSMDMSNDYILISLLICLFHFHYIKLTNYCFLFFLLPMHL